jgi:hypothetical protein
MMKGMLFVVASIGLTVLCWGVYGPVLHRGQVAMEGSRLRPLFCVGMAYFLIGVVVPAAILWTTGETGKFTFGGTAWSLAAGAAGAVGALGIILAFNSGGKPSYVMPLVFGCAPVINALVSIYWAGTWNEVKPIFLAGLILVAVGAFTVLFFAPQKPKPAPAEPSAASAPADTSGGQKSGGDVT